MVCALIALYKHLMFPFWDFLVQPPTSLTALVHPVFVIHFVFVSRLFLFFLRFLDNQRHNQSQSKYLPQTKKEVLNKYKVNHKFTKLFIPNPLFSFVNQHRNFKSLTYIEIKALLRENRAYNYTCFEVHFYCYLDISLILVI